MNKRESDRIIDALVEEIRDWDVTSTQASTEILSKAGCLLRIDVPLEEERLYVLQQLPRFTLKLCSYVPTSDSKSRLEFLKNKVHRNIVHSRNRKSEYDDKDHYVVYYVATIVKNMHTVLSHTPKIKKDVYRVQDIDQYVTAVAEVFNSIDRLCRIYYQRGLMQIFKDKVGTLSPHSM